MLQQVLPKCALLRHYGHHCGHQMLTDRQVKALKPREREYTMSDDTRQRGTGRLVIRVRPSGAKEWQYRYHLDGRKRRVSLGDYPATSLVAARDMALSLSGVLDKGEDPATHLKSLRDEQALSRSHGTLGELCDAYCDDMAAHGKSSAEEVRKRLARYIKDPFRSAWNTPAHEISSTHVRDMLAHHMQRGITTTTNRIRSYLHAAYQYGIESELNPRRRSRSHTWGLTSNPVSSIPRQADWERAGQTVMTAADIRGAWHDLPKMRSRSPQGPMAVRLCIATAGQRISALLRLRADMVNLEKGMIDMPPEITKTSEPHVIPLTRQAIEVLEYLLGESERRGVSLLFPNHRDSSKPMREDAVASLVIDYRKTMGAQHWTMRDIRRTAKTVLGELGVSKEIRDRIHGHALHDVSSRNYDRYGYLREKREGMEAWEAWLTQSLD